MLGSLVSGLASVASSFLSNNQAQKNANQQAQLQKDFAQSGIQWRVADAKKAGIHPLYALGANTHSYTPQTVGSDFSGLAQAGQNIGRAIDQTRSPAGKLEALQLGLLQSQVEGANLDNDIKRARLASAIATNRTTTGIPGSGEPGYDGQGNAIGVGKPTIKLETRRDVSDPANPQYVPGSGPSTGFIKNATGGYSPVIPPELAESYEADWLGGIDWMIRNRVAPYFGKVATPRIPHNPLTEDVVWRGQEWVVVPKKFKYMGRQPTTRSYGRNRN